MPRIYGWKTPKSVAFCCSRAIQYCSWACNPTASHKPSNTGPPQLTLVRQT